MTQPAALNSASYAAETAYGETTTTASTLQLALAAPIDGSGLVHTKIDPAFQKSRLMDGVQWILGTQEGTFKTKLWLTGHGSTTASTVTVGLHEALIANYVLGSGSGVAAAMAAGTTATGGTASAWTTTASGTGVSGGLVRLGALNDGRGGGAFYPIGTHITTTLTPVAAPPLAPTTGDVIYSSVTGYTQSTTTTQKSARFLLQGKSIQYLCHGCVPTAVAYSGLNTGSAPSVEITWSVAWWEYSTATFPSAVTTEQFTAGPCAAGSFFVNTVGTATSALRTMRDFTLTHTLGTILMPGTGGVNAYQKYVGAIRGPDKITVSWVEDADDTTGTPVLPGYATGTNAKHVVYSLNTIDGKAMGFYFPNLCITKVPTQYTDGNVNRLKIEAEAYTGPTTTTELTSSAMRMGWA